MGLLEDAIGHFFSEFIGLFLYTTGDVLLWIFTLGRHRIRWWDALDPNVTWPLIILGFVFWLGVGALVWTYFF